MTGSTHRIRRHHWRVRAPTAECAFATRMQLRAHVDCLLSVFGEAFDAVAANDDVVRIPRLALEVKLPRDASIAESFPPLLLEELGKALRRWAQTGPSAPGARRIPRPAMRREVLLHYLAHGRVPWHESAATPQALALDLRAEARALGSDVAAFTRMLQGSLTQRAAACFRWLQLIEADERSRAVAAAFEEADMEDAAIAVVLRRLAQQRGPSEYDSLRLQALVLAFVSLDARERAAPPTRRMLREGLDRAAATIVRNAIEEEDAARPQPPARDVEVADARAAQSRRTPRDESIGLESSPAVLAASAPMEDPEDGFAAHDAGLVLLHPYLPRLFEAAGIVAEGAREVPEAQLPRAAALLHHLLCGEEEIHEFELVAIKVLLGIAPDRMVLVGAGLVTAQDREEADALLAAVLMHWPGLASTSAAGLRRTFLQRRGVLRDVGHAWSLQVEPAAFDVLLASLPWTFNIVKLPWMTRPIFIEWPTP